MTTLIVVATKHGATAEIGDRISSTLSARGIESHVKTTAEASQWIHGADNIIVGMPVYNQKFLPAGIFFLDAHRTELSSKPIFFFAVGGSPSLAVDLHQQLHTYAHRESVYFRGAVDAEKLSFFEKMLLKALRQPTDMDLRDWPEIEHWADSLLAYGLQ